MWGFDHGGGVMGIGMILLWLVPIALLVWLFTRIAAGDRRDTNAPPRSPMEILDERYARGEIDRDEYQARRADLERSNKT
jgi:putative membrane protein